MGFGITYLHIWVYVYLFPVLEILTKIRCKIHYICFLKKKKPSMGFGYFIRLNKQKYFKIYISGFWIIDFHIWKIKCKFTILDFGLFISRNGKYNVTFWKFVSYSIQKKIHFLEIIIQLYGNELWKKKNPEQFRWVFAFFLKNRQILTKKPRKMEIYINIII